jgi:hypothetical protein
LRITRYPSLTEPQFFGCVAAFVDALTGELNSAAIALRRLEGRSKGAAFAYEMDLDSHRYAALIILDRWGMLVGTFAPHLEISRRQAILRDTPARVAAAEELLNCVNRLVDAAGDYSAEIVEACMAAYQSLNVTFAEERGEAEQSAKLGPMLPDDYREARRIFLEDLAAR